MLKLKCVAQNYDWGMIGGCQVAELGQLNTGDAYDKEKPYAELWMGTHPNAPSTVAANGTTLKDWIAAHPESLGDAVKGEDLPFLFKVLSVRKGLSIQAHPDKPAAEKLHAERPNVYKDPNHKPEMALAVTDFEALCQFVSPQELKEVMETVPEMVEIVGKEAADAVVAAGAPPSKMEVDPKGPLKAAFTALMTCPPDKVAAALDTLIARIEAKGAGKSAKEDLVMRMNQQYPKDVGVLAVYFLNHVVLKPGEGIYLAANEPHAYMSGECVEIMATSDNVVRAGLTPKLRDTDILCSMLTYQQGLPEVLNGGGEGGSHSVYQPPFDEFELTRVEAPAGKETLLQTVPGATLYLVFAGEGKARAAGPAAASAAELDAELDVGRGSVVFVPANTSVELKPSADMSVFHVGCSARVFGGVASGAAAVPAAAVA